MAAAFRYLEYDLLKFSDRYLMHVWVPVMQENESINLGQFKDIRKEIKTLESNLEKVACQYPGVTGWTINVEHSHPKIMNFVERVGGKPYLETDDFVWYVKEISLCVEAAGLQPLRHTIRYITPAF